MREWNDQDLLSAYANLRSEEAFGVLVERYIGLVYSAALRQVRKAHLAEEVTQATFTILAQKARQLCARATLGGWLCRTAHLVARNTLKTELRRYFREQEAHMQSIADEPEPETWHQLAPMLDEAVAQLNEADRNALVLRFYERKPLNEVGAILRVDPNTAQKRVSRALDKLRRFFASRGVNSTTAAIAENISAHSVHVAPITLAKTVTALALAKGAATSTSTLTLLKGAKIMSWTKAKTTAAVAVVAVLGVGTLFTINAIQTARITRLNNQHDIQGLWEGDMATGASGTSRTETARDRMVLKLSNGNGQYTATADLIDLGRKSVPVTINYAYPNLHLSINPQVMMDGQVNADGTLLNFTRFALRRTSSPDEVPDGLTEAMFTPRAGSDLQGYWKGTIDARPGPLPLFWKIAEESNGTFRAEMDNPNQGAMGQPATVIYNDPSVQLLLTSRDGMVQGEISSDKTEITGSWIEKGRAVPARFKRADYDADHAQDASKDYSFHSDSDLQGHWQGSFLLRKKPVKFPIVLDLDIARMPDGTFSATVASIYHLGNDGPRPSSDFKYAAPKLHIAWKWMDDQFDGRLKNGKLTGAWINGYKEWPIVFKRM